MSKISELSDGGVVQGGDTLIAVRSGGNVKVTYGGSTTANIDGGTIDDTVIGGTTPAAVTTTALVATTADINGGTIDGTVIGGTTAAAGTFTTGQFDTSVNVDGTVTADGLTVDGASVLNDSLTVKDSASPTITLTSFPGTQDTVATIFSGRAEFSGTDSFLRFGTNNGTSTLARLNIASDGDISFYEDTGTTAKFYWDASAERLGLGTDLPNTQLHLSGTSPRIQLTDTDTGADHRINADSGAGNLAFDVDFNSDTTAPSCVFNIKGAERMRIDSSGEVLINATATSNSNLFVAGSDGLAVGDGTNNAGYKMLCIDPATIGSGETLTLAFAVPLADMPLIVKFRYVSLSSALTMPSGYCSFSVEYDVGIAASPVVNERFEYGDEFVSGDLAITVSGATLSFAITHHGSHASPLNYRNSLIAEFYGFRANEISLTSQTVA